MANLEQWKTEGVLEAKLVELGVTIERETELVAIEERLDGIRATVKRPNGSSDVVDTPWLIGCDGAHSTVRHLNHQHFPGASDHRRYIAADVITDAPYARDTIYFFVAEAGFIGWASLPEGRTFVWGNIDDSTDRECAGPTLADVQALLDERSPQKVEVSDPRWISWYWTNYRLTPHYRHGRTILAGDAAHIHSSVGAQGMNTGIQDAYNLGWKLALVSQGRALESLLDSYEKERRAIGRDVLATTKSMAERVMSFGNFSETDRDRLYRHAHVPEADRLKAARHAAELDLDYRRSPISVENRHNAHAPGQPDGAPHAGAEAVDAGPLEADGRHLTAFELFAGPQHTLLLFTGGELSGRRQANALRLASEVVRVYGDLIRVCFVLLADTDITEFAKTEATIVRDIEGRMHERYCAEPGRSYLIRPDGYVGWRSDRPSLIALRDYLAKVFVRP